MWRTLRAEPKEAQFHALLGDIAGTRRDWDGAASHYDRAIALDDDYFGYFLQRGKVDRARNADAAARADFERSIALLPTADAQKALGILAGRRGDRREAQSWAAAAATRRRAAPRASPRAAT